MKNLLRRISKFYQWSHEFKMILIEATFQSLKYEFYLRTNGFHSIKTLHKNQYVTGEFEESEKKLMGQITKAMKLLKKFALWRPKCYNRALTAKKMLSKRGIETTLNIGFIKKDESFEGHAWLTYKGELVSGFIEGLHNYQKLEGTEFLQNFKVD